jgi:hypothetical protein
MQGEQILIKSSALISLILVLFALTAFTCFGQPYSVALQIKIRVIIKDISTVRYEPQRLWQGQEIAMELVQDFI